MTSKPGSVRNSRQTTVWCAVLCVAVLAPGPLGSVKAAPQEEPPASLDRIKERLEAPVTRRLTPAAPVRLRPTFRSRVDQRVFVPTLEEDLHKTFDLTDFQRKYAEYSARGWGYDLGQIVRFIDKALEERKLRKTREQIARELAELEAARAASRR